MTRFSAKEDLPERAPPRTNALRTVISQPCAIGKRAHCECAQKCQEPRQPPCWHRERCSLGSGGCPSRTAGLLAHGATRQKARTGPPRLPEGAFTKRWTIRRKRGVPPRLIVTDFSGFSGMIPDVRLPHHAASSPIRFRAGWRTLTVLQSRGRLRWGCPAWVHPFAFPFTPENAPHLREPSMADD